MRIIPVIDLMAGQVVRGVAGRRQEYRAIQSTLCADPAPQSVARALVERLGFEEAYLADLDAILGAEPCWEVYRRVMACGLSLWVDAGTSSVKRARDLAQFVVGNKTLGAVVAGLESVPDAEALRTMHSAIGPQQLVFSLDLKDGLPLSKSPAWQGCNAEQIARSALQIGVRRMIVLDLARVGMGGGVGTLTLCQQLRSAEPTLELVAGGGVAGMDDLAQLSEAGCDAALVASALHDGRLGPTEIRQVAQMGAGPRD